MKAVTIVNIDSIDTGISILDERRMKILIEDLLLGFLNTLFTQIEVHYTQATSKTS